MDEISCRRFLPDRLREKAIDARQIFRGDVSKVEGLRMDAVFEMVGLTEEAREAFCVPKESFASIFIRGRFLPGLREEVAHLVDGFAWVRDAKEVFIEEGIRGPWAQPALKLEVEEATHGVGRGAKHVMAKGIIDGVGVGIGIPEAAQPNVCIEREANAIGRRTNERAIGEWLHAFEVVDDDWSKEVRRVREFGRPTDVMPIKDLASRGASPGFDEVFFVNASGWIFEEGQSIHCANGGFNIIEGREVEAMWDGAGVDIRQDADKIVGMCEAHPGRETSGKVRPEKVGGRGVEAKGFIKDGATSWASARNSGVPWRNRDCFAGGIHDTA